MLWTVVDTGMKVIYGAAEVEGFAGLGGLNTGDLDTFKEMADEAVVEVGGASADWQVVDDSDGGAMTDVEVGVSVLGSEIEGIAWQAAVAGTRSERVAAIIQRVGIGVAAWL